MAPGRFHHRVRARMYRSRRGIRLYALSLGIRTGVAGPRLADPATAVSVLLSMADLSDLFGTCISIDEGVALVELEGD